eukprot:gene6027-6265_t
MGKPGAASQPQQKPVLKATLESASEAVVDSASGEKEVGEPHNHNVLQELLVWLMANGVTGIGTESSMVALYQDALGDRGVIAVQDIAAGEQLLHVPLRLAITDFMEKREQQQLVGQALFVCGKLYAGVALAGQAGGKTPAASTAGAGITLLVMSRTFGNAAQAGGIGVRMLVPLIDMLNHAGDETVSGMAADSSITARDNVRWDVVSPDNSPNGCWEMVLSAKQDIPANNPLLLSYFEGSNDEFFLHYGFVPPSNPHDTFVLFPGITAALEHLWHQDMAQIASGSRISNALVAALEVLHGGNMAAVEAAVAALAWQRLTQLPTSLLYDLALLVADCQAHGDQQAAAEQEQLLRHYLKEMVPAYAPNIAEQLQAAAAVPACPVMPSAFVSGATGYVASELIKQLLARGYDIKATIRSAPERLQYLQELAHASDGSLQLFQVPDLEQPSEALDNAIAGSEYVFHVASPFRFV